MPGLYRTPEEKKRLESRNGALQFLAVLEQIERWKAGESALTPDLLKALQYRAIVGIYTCAGNFRTGPVLISGAVHQPPPWQEIEGHVAELCSYIAVNWQKTPIYLASYVLWRLNWIHPFFGGNGRTARATSYLILCARLGFRLPGEKTIADYIVDRRDEYLDALRAADAAWERGVLDLERMERLMESVLAAQLVSVVQKATGRAIET